MKKKLIMIAAFLSCAGLSYGDHDHWWKASDANAIIAKFGQNWHTQSDLPAVNHQLGNKRFVQVAYDAVKGKLPPLNYGASDADALIKSKGWHTQSDISRVGSKFGFRVFSQVAYDAVKAKLPPLNYAVTEADALIASQGWKVKEDVPNNIQPVNVRLKRDPNVVYYRGQTPGYIVKRKPVYNSVVDGRRLGKAAYDAVVAKLPPLNYAIDDVDALIKAHPEWKTITDVPAVNTLINYRKFIASVRNAVLNSDKFNWTVDDVDALIKAHPEWKSKSDVPVTSKKVKVKWQYTKEGKQKYKTVNQYNVLVDGKLLPKTVYDAVVAQGFSWTVDDAATLISSQKWNVKEDVSKVNTIVGGKSMTKDVYSAVVAKLPSLNYSASDAADLIQSHPEWKTLSDVPAVNSMIGFRKFVASARNEVLQRLSATFIINDNPDWHTQSDIPKVNTVVNGQLLTSDLIVSIKKVLPPLNYSSSDVDGLIAKHPEWKTLSDLPAVNSIVHYRKIVASVRDQIISKLKFIWTVDDANDLIAAQGWKVKEDVPNNGKRFKLGSSQYPYEHGKRQSDYKVIPQYNALVDGKLLPKAVYDVVVAKLPAS